jgi:TPR repeat protein
MWQYGAIHDPSERTSSTSSKEFIWHSWNHLVEESYEVAEYWYRKAIDTPNCGGLYGMNHQAENSLSFLLVTLGRYSEAAITYRILAEKEFIPAQLQMARLYRDGLGVTQSHKMSAKWFRKAANLGSAIGQFKMGIMYSHPVRTSSKSRYAKNKFNLPYDLKKSRTWYRKAAEQNHLSAMFNLAQSYQARPDRLPADTDESESMKWFQKAAVLGDTSAMYQVGSIYYRGDTPTFSSFKKAMAWFHKAILPNQDTLHPYGHADAIYWLGVMHFYGEGIEAMPFAANFYWKKASLQNHKKAENALLTNGESIRGTSSVLGNVPAGWHENGDSCSLSRLYCACQKNDTEEVDRLLLNPRETADANKPETLCNLAKDLSTPLLVASFRGYTSIVRRLLTENNIILSVNLQKSKDGMTPLLAACQKGHTKIVKLLLDVKGIDVNLPNTLDGASGLYFACQNGLIDIVKLLLGVYVEGQMFKRNAN